MGRQIYSKNGYIVFRAYKGFVIHNTKKPFKCGHTHVDDFDTAKYLIHLSSNKLIPNHFPVRFWVSLERISTDKVYCKKLRCVIDELNIKRRSSS